MRMRISLHGHIRKMNCLSFLVFFGLIQEIQPTNGNNKKPWPWTSLQLPFPKPVLYDIGLSTSFKVSVHFKPRGRISPVYVEFTFSEPFGLQCDTGTSGTQGKVEFNYTLVLQGRESKYPRHIGPYHGKACDRNFQVNVADLRRDSEYRAYMVVYNASTSLKSTQLYFTTTDVQWAHVVKGVHCALITCHFVPGTRAKGCRISAQVMNAHTSARVKTRYFTIRRKYGVNEASKCISLDNNLSLGSVEVVDWKENGELGTLRIATAIEESPYTPYYEATLLLSVTSTVLFLSGAVLVMLSYTVSSCKLGQLCLKFKRSLCKPSKRNCCTSVGPILPEVSTST